MITTGQRIKYLRTRSGLSLKEFGLQLGFSPASADVRVAQYESGARTPKAELLERMADILDVPAEYLSVPVLETPEEMQVMRFWLERFGR